MRQVVCRAFSPLFIAAMVATQLDSAIDDIGKSGFQSPFHRGNGCYLVCNEYLKQQFTPFSPLFIGDQATE